MSFVNFPIKFFNNFSLGSKFIVLVIVILSIAMSFATLVNVKAQLKLLSSQLDAKGKMIGDYIATTSPEYILSNDFVSLNESMKAITLEKDTIYSFIVDNYGNYLTNYIDKSDPVIRKELSGMGEYRLSKLIFNIKKNNDILFMNFPIIFNDENLGVYLIGISKKRVNALVRKIFIDQVFYNLIIILFLVFCIYIVFRDNVLEPIRSLITGSQRVADGDLTSEVNKISNDELGSLTNTFNLMVFRLRNSVEEKDIALFQLQEFNKQLETRVEDRTKQIEKTSKEMEYMALHDGLTGLPNRILLLDRLQQGIQYSIRHKEQVALILMDLMRFKDINDTLGHHIGDLLLCEVGKRLQTVLRRIDTVARLGGDEFSIVLPSCDAENASIVSRKILKALEAPIILNDNLLYIGGSLGISVYPDHGDDVTLLLQRADVAMYVAKRNETGYVVYDTSQDKNSISRLKLLSELKDAISNDDLILFFQPQIDFKTGVVCGVEALVRWVHKERGMIPPDEFIGIAEQSGLINNLTMWVLNSALENCAYWCGKGFDIKMAVNISARNLKDPGFPNEIKILLDKWSVDAGSLVLEITESFVMEDPLEAMKILSHLSNMGISLSIDDFGTGYSSLAYLQKLPVNELKIDKSFVMGMIDSADSTNIVRSIIDLAHNLGLEVVAEGVENQDVWDKLEAMGCEVAQGFYMSKPIPSEEIESWFLESQWKIAK